MVPRGTFRWNKGGPTSVEDANEQQRLTRLYEQLRLKLLDLSKKNPMLNYRLGTRSKRHLQIVDEVLEEVYRKLVGEEAAFKIAFLQAPDDIPPEEKTEDFISALEYAKVSDIEYLTSSTSWSERSATTRSPLRPSNGSCGSKFALSSDFPLDPLATILIEPIMPARSGLTRVWISNECARSFPTTTIHCRRSSIRTSLRA
jgi:hypothetical protein